MTISSFKKHEHVLITEPCKSYKRKYKRPIFIWNKCYKAQIYMTDFHLSTNQKKKLMKTNIILRTDVFGYVAQLTQRAQITQQVIALLSDSDFF